MLYVAGGALALFTAYTILLRWGWRRARQEQPGRVPASLPALSVVVAARNEADALPRLLRALEQQSHPDYEVVLVDDASSDDTAAQAERWVRDRPHARLVTIDDPRPPRKKRALAAGIEAASHDLLAFTDADCAPPPDWLSTLAVHHAATDDDTVLIGYSPVRGGGVLGQLARYEAVLEYVYAVGAAGLNRAYLAVGRSLSYPRSVWSAVDGFAPAADLLSGDDDLFVQAVRRRGAATVRPVLDPRSFVPTPAPPSWHAWWQQRRRHASAGRAYAWGTGVHLTLGHASLGVLWMAPFLLGTTGVGLWATGLLVRHALLAPAADTLDERDVLPFFPLGEFGYLFYLLVAGPLGLLAPPDEW